MSARACLTLSKAAVAESDQVRESDERLPTFKRSVMGLRVAAQ